MKKFVHRVFPGLPRCLSFRQDRRGTAVLEMAILTPVLMIIGLGVIEFGNLIYKRHLIENGVRDAARYMAGMPNCNDATLQADAARIATYGKITVGKERVTGWQLTAADIDCTPVPATYGTDVLRGSGLGGPGMLMIVEVESTVTYSTIELGFLKVLDRLGLGFRNMSFPVHHEERYYGNR